MKQTEKSNKITTTFIELFPVDYVIQMQIIINSDSSLGLGLGLGLAAFTSKSRLASHTA